MYLDKVVRPVIKFKNDLIVDCCFSSRSRDFGSRSGQPRPNGQNHGLQR